MRQCHVVLSAVMQCLVLYFPNMYSAEKAQLQKSEGCFNIMRTLIITVIPQLLSDIGENTIKLVPVSPAHRISLVILNDVGARDARLCFAVH